MGMKSKLASIVLCSTFLLTACEKPISTTVETREYIVSNIKRPKHFRVDLTDAVTGQVYRDKSISKHCNRWREVEDGSHFYLPTTLDRYEDNTYYFHIDARSICPR